MLSVEPILERALRMSGGPDAELGRAVVLEVAVVVEAVVEEAARGARGTGGFFSGTVPEVEDGVAGLAPAAAAVRVREAAVVVLRAVLVVVEVLGLVESGWHRERDGY